MTTYNDSIRLGDVLKREFDKLHCRDGGTLITGQNLAIATILGMIKVLAGAGAVAAPTFTGTGNGGITMDATTPVLAGAQLGTYTARCISTATNSGTFLVTGPDGKVIGQVVVGATFANQIKFVIADGSSDYVLNDTFSIVVVAGSRKVTQLAPAAVDGSQDVVGMLLSSVDATAADKPCVYLARGPAVLASSAIVWPAGISAANKQKAIDQLAALGIVIRTDL